jgi:capsid assembly protease
VSQLAKLLSDHPLALDPRKLHEIEAFVKHRLQGGAPIEGQVAATSRSGSGYSMLGSVAILPVFGTISQRMNMLSSFSGGTSTELLARDLRNALADPQVSTILLRIDSPGGSVYGVQEIADEIFKARSKKRIVAHADSLAASAAYWIGSQADEFYVTPSGEVGSIGVVAMHVDYSKMLGDAGVNVTYIHAGAYKVEGNPYEPLGDEARDFQQSRVNDYHRQFVSAVARGRGVTISTVAKTFGQGRTYGADQALAARMVDGIKPFDTTIAALAKDPGARSVRAGVRKVPIVSSSDRAIAEAVYLSTMDKRPPASYFDDPIHVQVWRDMAP